LTTDLLKRPCGTARPRTTTPGIRTGDATGQQEARGKKKQLVGQGKEIVGIITGDGALELEGDRQQAEGEVQERVGKARRKVGEFVDGVAKTIKK
jgi:uncharacterized protein YjbJ (UPF0337 family)